MHKTIWFKIHWFLGVTAGIVLLIVGLTGSILSFEKEIMNTINKDTYKVSIPFEQEKLSTKELLEKFKIQMPEAKINSITFSNDKVSSVVINIAGEGKEARKGINYYIDPYDAKILEDLKGKEFFSFILTLHRWLAFSSETREVGKQIVSISTIALIVLIISGILIYWDRIKRVFFKSFTFSFKHKGRAFLSTMHSAVGMWVIPFYILVSLTGLTMSYDFLNDSFYKLLNVEKPQKMQKPKVSNKDNNIQNFEEYQKAIELFNVLSEKDYSTATLRIPQNGTIYSFNYLDKNPHHFRAMNVLELDTNLSSLIKNEKFNDKSIGEKLLKSVLPLHTGEYFGLIGQIGMFIASLLMSLFVITGFMLYINRKKKKKAKQKI